MFLNLEGGDPSTLFIEWFVNCNILVWYSISSKILDFACKNPTHAMSKFVPPPKILDAWIQSKLTQLPNLPASGTIQFNAPTNCYETVLLHSFYFHVFKLLKSYYCFLSILSLVLLDLILSGGCYDRSFSSLSNHGLVILFLDL